MITREWPNREQMDAFTYSFETWKQVRDKKKRLRNDGWKFTENSVILFYNKTFIRGLLIDDFIIFYLLLLYAHAHRTVTNESQKWPIHKIAQNTQREKHDAIEQLRRNLCLCIPVGIPQDFTAFHVKRMNQFVLIILSVLHAQYCTTYLYLADVCCVDVEFENKIRFQNFGRIWIEYAFTIIFEAGFWVAYVIRNIKTFWIFMVHLEQI